MENLIDLGRLLKVKEQLDGRLFTRLQLNVLEKKLKNQPLDNNEKTYYYKFIRPKIKAIFSFLGLSDINVQGRAGMLNERIPVAAALIKKLEKKHKKKRIMVSGSFLFQNNYHDIDVFIFSKYKKEDYRQGKVHVNFMPETALDSLFFSSLCQISVSNFAFSPQKEFKLGLNDILQSFELIANCMINDEDCQKELRDFLIGLDYLSKGIILNPKQLYFLKEKIAHGGIKFLKEAAANALILSYKKEVLVKKLWQQIESYASLLKDYNTAKNLNVYIETYRQVIELAA